MLSVEEANRLWWTRDPRWSDLPEDRELWMALLDRAYGLDGDQAEGVFASLHGLRCLGAQLRREEGGYRINPGEIDSGDYFALRRRYLQPRADEIRGLLQSLATD